MSTRIHANGITGAGLDAEAAIDTAQRIDLVANGKFFDGVVRILAGFNVNTFGGTRCRAEKTGRALNRTVFLQGQPVSPAKGVGIRRPLVRVLDGNRCLKTLCQSKLMENMDEQISPEAVASNHQPSGHLRKVKSFPKTHLFNS